MDKPFLSLFTPEELSQLMREACREEIRNKVHEELQEKLLSPKETRNLFRPAITDPTLARWTKNGWLTKYEIGGRNFYKYSEVIQAMKTIKRYQRD